MRKPKAVFVPDWEKAKMLSQTEWSHTSCLHIICLYLSASGAVLSKIHLQNIFTLKPVSGQEIKTASKMFKAALQCRFVWLLEKVLLYSLQVLNTFFPDIWLRNAEYFIAGKALTTIHICAHCKSTWPKEKPFRTFFLKIMFYWKPKSFEEACQHWPTLS